MLLLVSTLLNLASATVPTVKPPPPSCASYLEVELSFDERYRRLRALPTTDKIERFKVLRDLVERIVGLAHGRPMDSGNDSSGMMTVTIVSGGFSGLKLDDIATADVRDEMVRLMDAEGISHEMWVLDRGQTFPNEGYNGLTKLILEYEHMLSGFRQGLVERNAKLAAFVFDKTISKHQVYLRLPHELKAAIDEDFQPVGFSFRGIVIPPNYPAPIVGSELLLEIGEEFETKSMAQINEEFLRDLSQMERAVSVADQGDDIFRAALPESWRNVKMTVEYATQLRDDWRERATRKAVTSPGIYRGTVVEVFPAGFHLKIGDDIITFNTNLGVRFKSLSIRPPSAATIVAAD